MTIQHAWKKQQYKPPKMVPMDQVEAAVTIASHNSVAFAIQMVQEQMLLMLHDEFGFGRDRCMRALAAIQEKMTEWQKNVEDEFDSETFRLNCKQKQEANVDLAWTWEAHDRALEPLVDPGIWRPYQERYNRFGGRGSWCKK